jgi:TMEM175 potassium channel family protein
MAPDAPAVAKPRYSRDDSEFDRAIGFIDATFALALTLLITTLEIGDRSAWESLGSLNEALGAQFIAFAIAFVVISGYWLRHHRMVASFTAIDYPVIGLNLALVATIVLLPFSTQAVGDPGIEDLALPTALMAVNIAAASMLHGAVYWLARHRGLMSPPPSSAETNQYLLNAISTAGVFLLSIPVAYLLSPDLGRAFWLALIPIGYLLDRRAKRLAIES